jgi:regulator of protease activity HflC (stomatin/prohibitin superfamily)
MKALWAGILGLIVTGCSSYAPDAGHEVVLIRKPWFFGHGGVVADPVTTGRVWTAITTEGVDISMQPQRREEDMNDIMSSDGVPLGFHAIITLQVIEAVELVTKFGPDWYQNNVEQQFQQLIRQAVRKHDMNQVAINPTAVGDIDNEVRSGLETFFHSQALPVQILTMTVGRAIPPDAIKDQRIQTATQEQRIQTEKQVTLAEEQRALAEAARAKADNAYRQAIGLTPQEFIDLQRINMQALVCGPQGHTTCTFIQNGSATPVMDVRSR